DLVESYTKAAPAQKPALIEGMIKKSAWLQILKLYAGEKNSEVRETLRDLVSKVAMRAARESLRDGDDPRAKQYLEMAPVGSEGLLALAEFHRTHGTLDAELKRAKSIKGENSAFWQLALQRASGNSIAARDAAEAAGETNVAALMSALVGNPLPWLEVSSQDMDKGALGEHYTAVASKRWMNAKIRPEDLAPFKRSLNSRNKDEQHDAMTALFLLGEAEMAGPVFSKISSLPAFNFYEGLERVPEALAALGLKSDQPDYKAWVGAAIQKLSSKNIEDQHGASDVEERVLAMANFLERRGLHQEAYAAFADPLADFSKKSPKDFLVLLGSLFGNHQSVVAPMLAKKIAVEWAGEDDKKWGEVVSAVFGDDEIATGWWGWFGEIDPKSSYQVRFDGMLALFGLGPDPQRLREKCIDLAWKTVAAAPQVRRNVLLRLISTQATNVGDVKNGLKSWNLLPEDLRAEVYWVQHIVNLAAVGDWNAAADVILKQIDTPEDDSEETDGKEPRADIHAYAAAALRKAGRNDEAAFHAAMAEKLWLGDATLALRIGGGYAFGYDFKTAAQWWAKAAIMVNPDSDEFGAIMKLHSETLLEDGKWKEAAATSEVVCQVYLMSGNLETNPLVYMHQRLDADTARALFFLKSDRPTAISILKKIHQTFLCDGTLADFFFPTLRKVGLVREHDEWFDASWNQFVAVIDQYPEAYNSLNTAAWFASRSLRKLDEGEKYLKTALEANPCQPAFLDTMAEIQFAKGNRNKAIEWSGKAMNYGAGDSQLARQHDRFLHEPLPK
ncbi:MAG: hypothetical protein H8M99_15050, partial [Gloeobacteraceae cyanobacterium ES-bin-144]|nr:hypothetical protein [Verrucomicrobiales bacterium]